MNERFICVTECYYLSRLWQPGYFLPEGARPNRHFVQEKDYNPNRKSEVTIFGPGDDPRSTKKLISDLKSTFGIEMPQGSSRKDAWQAWHDAEISVGVDLVRTVEKQEIDDPLKGKSFAKMTPSELDSTPVKSIAASVMSRYGIELNCAGKKKADVIKQVLQIEQENCGPLAPLDNDVWE